MKPDIQPSANMISIGTDIVKIDRFRSMSPDSPFVKRTFSEAELAYCTSYSSPGPHLAATFAGKEAVVKALSNRIAITISDVEILRAEAGIPYVILNPPTNLQVAVSLSHSKSYAVAMAIAYPHIESIDSEGLRKLLNGSISQIQPE